MATSRFGLWAVLLASASCTGVIDRSEAGAGGDGGGFNAGGSQGVGGANGMLIGNQNLSCSAKGVRASPAPLARLSNQQLRRSIADLFPGVTLPNIDLPADTVTRGEFDNNANGQTPSPVLAERLQITAEDVAASVLPKLASVLPCAAGATVDTQKTCGHTFVASLGARAFRRPLANDESTRIDNMFDSVLAQADFATAARAVIEALLQAPQFLYRIELGDSARRDGEVFPLADYELASRLSYALWGSLPDEDLMVAARAGALREVQGLELQARRMLESPKAHVMVADFHSQWLEFVRFSGLRKDSALFPFWNADTVSALSQSLAMFTERAFWQVGDLAGLLTDHKAFVDARLAPLYGVAAPIGAGMQLVDLDATQRTGLLTQAGFLAAYAHEAEDAPVRRGMFVLERLLCAPPPPPPANVNTTPPAAGGGRPASVRARESLSHLTSSVCSECHRVIDGVGFGFEHYDAVGRWRTTDEGLTVNATGSFMQTEDLDGPFDGAIQMSSMLAASPQVQTCVAGAWLRYTRGLDKASVDDCTLAAIVQRLRDGKLNFRELLVATVTSDAFRYRPAY